MILRIGGLLVALTILGGSSFGQLISNGGFESNFTAWTLAGGIESIGTANSNGFPADSGSRYAQLETEGDPLSAAVSASTLETFFALSSNTLKTLGGGGTPDGGSGIKQVITITAGDVGKLLDFKWDLVSDNDTFAGNTTQRDYAFVTINGNANLFKLADIQTPLMHTSTANNGAFSEETGWQRFSSYQFTAPGSYTIGFGVISIEGNLGATATSGVLVDTIQLTAVPEPQQWLGLAAGGLGLFAAARRLRQRNRSLLSS